ncbi:DMT family transporter [Lacticaseibacillus baoqingensis]|uniref:DMT family transporter n=1 Tax=Lacticaseibacillus baoqingensis TaxID=2486013 RepID=A0ABW4ECA0_9LACO|nr:multidrug efflux SMR transporter [Lacticaseibacillus baoqingensis]
MGYVYLSIAIIGEFIGTNCLKASQGFTHVGWTLATFLAYTFCFYWFSVSLKSVPLNLAYALWSGIGIVVTAILSALIWHENISLTGVLGMMLIIVGAVIMNFSEA